MVLLVSKRKKQTTEIPSNNSNTNENTESSESLENNENSAQLPNLLNNNSPLLDLLSSLLGPPVQNMAGAGNTQGAVFEIPVGAPGLNYNGTSNSLDNLFQTILAASPLINPNQNNYSQTFTPEQLQDIQQIVDTCNTSFEIAANYYFGYSNDKNLAINALLNDDLNSNE